MAASLPPLPTTEQAVHFLRDHGSARPHATARRPKPRHDSKSVRLDVSPSRDPPEPLERPSSAAAVAAELKRTPRYQYFEELEANEYALCSSESAGATAAAFIAATI